MLNAIKSWLNKKAKNSFIKIASTLAAAGATFLLYQAGATNFFILALIGAITGSSTLGLTMGMTLLLGVATIVGLPILASTLTSHFLSAWLEETPDQKAKSMPASAPVQLTDTPSTQGTQPESKNSGILHQYGNKATSSEPSIEPQKPTNPGDSNSSSNRFS